MGVEGQFVSERAEAEYCQKVYDASAQGQSFYAKCTPDWRNNGGDLREAQKTLNTSFPGGALEFSAMLQKMRDEGRVFEGLEVT